VRLDKTRERKGDFVWRTLVKCIKHRDAFLKSIGEKAYYRISYEEISRRMDETLEEERKKAQKGETKGLGEHAQAYLYDDELRLRHLKLFLSDDYPPSTTDFMLLQRHLETLWLFYTCCAPEASLVTESQIDYVMAVLTTRAHLLARELERRGHTKDRGLDSTKAKQAISSARKQVVIEEYYRLDPDRRKLLSKHRIAMLIHELLPEREGDPKKKKIRSVTQIKRDLEEEGLF
jgi:hypothetical protein